MSEETGIKVLRCQRLTAGYLFKIKCLKCGKVQLAVFSDKSEMKPVLACCGLGVEAK